MPAKSLPVLILLLVVWVASCADDPVVPPPDIRPPLVSGELRIANATGYSTVGTVDLDITSYSVDSCTVWNGGIDDHASGLRFGLVDGRAEIEDWQLADGEGMRRVYAGFGVDGAGFTTFAVDSIVVDGTPPESAPAVEFPAAGHDASAPVTMLKWQAASDAL